MTITTYKNFQKRINSTKQPTGGTNVTALLKESTSLKNPVFQLVNADFEVNYVKWEGHYYYVNDIVSVNNDIYELYCSMDDLASHKSEIGSTKAYVEYSSNTVNKWIPDQRITVSNETTVVTGDTALFDASSGTYVLGVVGTDESTVASRTAQVGFANYWAVNASQLSSLNDYLFDTDFAEEFFNKMGDAYNAVIEVHWIPYDLGLHDLGFICLGKNSTNIQAKGLKRYVNTNNLILSKIIEIPWIYEDWRSLSPYTKLVLYLPFYGNIELDPAEFVLNDEILNKITIQVSLDPIGGEIAYGLVYGLKTATYRADCSVSIPVGQIRGNKTTGVVEIIGGAGAVVGGVISAVASEGLTVPAVAAMAGGVGSIGKGIISQFSQEVTSKGGAGMFGQSNLVQNSSYFNSIRYTLKSHKISLTNLNDLNPIEGKPLYNVKTISSIPGYIKCAGASVNMAGLEADKAVINNYLNSGFYYE